MSSSRVLLLVALVVALSSSVSLVSAQSATTVYFTYYSPTSTYPAVCTTGTLSCTAQSNGSYSCPSVTGGTHYYYPAASSPTFSSALVTAAQPALCERYTADFQVPLTVNGVSIAYGSTNLPVCVNMRLHNTSGSLLPYADPDAVVAASVNFTWGLSQSSVAACPSPVAATASGSATLYFSYTIIPTSAYTTTVCAAGSMSCSALGNNQYNCQSLNSGTEYRYNSSTNTTSTTTLTGIVECNGFGDGYFPLDYEGISFGGSFFSNGNCVSWYGTNGQNVGFDYNVIGDAFHYQNVHGTSNFSTSTNAIIPASFCQAYIPYIPSGTGGGTGASGGTTSASTGGTPTQSSASHVAVSVFSLVAALLAVLALFA